MVSEQFIVFFKAVRIDFFYGPSYLLVNLLFPFIKKAVIGDLLSEGVFEYVFQLWKKLLLGNKFQTLKVQEMGFEFLSHSCNSS